MKLLLFGKDGQVGEALQPALRQLGEVVACGRSEADFERPGELPRLVAALAPDVIVNAAAYTAVDRAETDAERARLVNSEAVALLADAARRQDAWLVHYSTDYVFDGSKASPYLESDPANPLSVYGSTKLRADLAIAESGCRHLIFRVGWVYAPAHQNFPAAMLRLGRERASLEVVADQVGAPTSAARIAAATAAALQRIRQAGEGGAALAGLYHFAAGGAVSRADLARFIIATARARGAELALCPDGIVPVPSAARPAPAARPRNSRLDTEKIRATFGIVPPAWEDDMERWVTQAVRGGGQ